MNSVLEFLLRYTVPSKFRGVARIGMDVIQVWLVCGVLFLSSLAVFLYVMVCKVCRRKGVPSDSDEEMQAICDDVAEKKFN